MVTTKLCNELEKGLNKSGPTIISICGAADLGKSYLSQKMVEWFTKQGLKTRHFTLDSYLMDREDRKKKGLSGYNVEAYNLTDATNCLMKLKNKQSIKYRPYDHKSGKKAKAFIEIPAVDILIFDGLHSMYSKFTPYIDTSVFIYTGDEYLKRIRKESDLIKRNYTVEYSDEISQSEFNLYKTCIEPYKNKSNYLLFLESKWNYILTKTK
ncbi:uridine kinase family protein [Spongiimicrobium salis]|uniref:uridine kinase family protein n=1 Tax=Spongiimicrobium salis TaxID=1667022 RepID=UPI00374CE9B4